jgi:hypothetical protein
VTFAESTGGAALVWPGTPLRLKGPGRTASSQASHQDPTPPPGRGATRNRCVPEPAAVLIPLSLQKLGLRDKGGWLVPQRICEVCGAGFHQGPGRPARYCPAHRGRYGAPHQAARAAGIEQAYDTPCCRCGRLMRRGQAIHLDHTDSGTGYRGFAHASCNTSAGASRGNKMRAAAYRAQVNGQPVKPRRPPPVSPSVPVSAPVERPPVTCQFHDPPQETCPHSRDW